MTVDAVGRTRPDLGLDRVLDLSRASVHTRTVRRRLLVVSTLVVVVGGTMTATMTWPEVVDRPVLPLSRDDRGWVRARVAAGAPVTEDQHEVVATAAGWMARRRGAAPLYLGLTLEGLGFTIAGGGILSVLVGLVLVVEGVVLLGLALHRARSARRWLAFYA